MSARRVLAFVCIAVFWGTGHLIAEYYPFSPLGMFESSATMASRIFVRDAAGEARDVSRYVDWHCDGPLDFKPAGTDPACQHIEYSAYDQIVRDYIVAEPAAAGAEAGRVPVEITRRVFRIPD